MELNPQKVEELRKDGWRPTAVLAIISDQKVLMVYQEKFDVWQLPQGGIEAGEDPKDAFTRELAEELGAEAAQKLNIKKERIVFLREDQLEFHPESQERLKSKEGQAHLIGKSYLSFAAPAAGIPAEFPGSQFQDHRLLNFEQAVGTLGNIPPKGKKMITQNILQLLKGARLIS